MSGSENAHRAQLDEKDAEIAEQKEELKQVRAAELEVRAERRKIEKERETWELDQSRMLDRVTRQERELAEKNAEALFRAQIEELEQHKQALREQLEAAHRKASAGTRPQNEGVVRQELFADELRSRWPEDDIRVIKRGQKGADVIQTVRDGKLDCGTIVWECKWTQDFQPKWISKLTEDAKAHGAKIAVLVSAVLPRGVDGSGWVNGTLVCDFATAVHVVGPFRQLLISTKRHELANNSRGRADLVYDYFTIGEGFANLAKIVRSVQSGMEKMALFDNYMRRFMTGWNKTQQDIIDSVYTIGDDLEATGTELPAPLRAELPSAERLALLPPDDSAQQSDDPDEHDAAA